MENFYNKLVIIDQKNEQEIETTRCVKHGATCNNTQEEDRKVVCAQKYTKIILRAIGDDGRAYNERFYYPSACVCQVYKNIKNN
ncbi:hypothetical protein PVAND_003300 [Polypedilum vanderplanki]|uniref:Spaetzle domain-containing protein n=1 Tax=Polypedilum vanderplanki TaxID=319348 RepID=A0A9J6BUL9_POLVA|nr:hypothetical protein PVAND_003300 [Polypedilum vanderplanki]